MTIEFLIWRMKFVNALRSWEILDIISFLNIQTKILYYLLDSFYSVVQNYITCEKVSCIALKIEYKPEKYVFNWQETSVSQL